MIDAIAGLVVLINVAVLGLETSSSWDGFNLIDCLFTAFYLLEIAVKIGLIGCG